MAIKLWKVTKKKKKILTNIKVQSDRIADGGGTGVAPDKLKAITNDNYEKQLQSLYDTNENSGYNYFDLFVDNVR